MLGTEISDNTPQMEVPGLHDSTHCCGTGPSPRNWRRFCHGMGQHNSCLADVHSARARYHEYLLEDGPGERYVRMGRWYQKMRRANLSTL
jgi:hypothetical protein